MSPLGAQARWGSRSQISAPRPRASRWGRGRAATTGQTNERCLRQSRLDRKAEGSTIGVRIPSLSFGDPNVEVGSEPQVLQEPPGLGSSGRDENRSTYWRVGDPG